MEIRVNQMMGAIEVQTISDTVAYEYFFSKEGDTLYHEYTNKGKPQPMPGWSRVEKKPPQSVKSELRSRGYSVKTSGSGNGDKFNIPGL